MDNTARNRPASTTLRVDLSDGVLAHPRCDVCHRYIPEDRIWATTKAPRNCSKKCTNVAASRRKRARQLLERAIA